MENTFTADTTFLWSCNQIQEKFIFYKLYSLIVSVDGANVEVNDEDEDETMAELLRGVFLAFHFGVGGLKSGEPGVR